MSDQIDEWLTDRYKKTKFLREVYSGKVGCNDSSIVGEEEEAMLVYDGDGCRRIKPRVTNNNSYADSEYIVEYISAQTRSRNPQ